MSLPIIVLLLLCVIVLFIVTILRVLSDRIESAMISMIILFFLIGLILHMWSGLEQNKKINPIIQPTQVRVVKVFESTPGTSCCFYAFDGKDTIFVDLGIEINMPKVNDTIVINSNWKVLNKNTKDSFFRGKPVYEIITK